MTNKRTFGLPLICRVCGDVARGINFDVMTCMSCKIFFRRNVTKPKVSVEILIGKCYSLFYINQTDQACMST
jgi:hypothetical protein